MRSPLDDSQKDSLALIKYGPDLQRAIAEKIAAGEASSVAQGAALDAGEPEAVLEPMPIEKQVGQISKVWGKVSDDAKRAFVDLLKAEGFI